MASRSKWEDMVGQLKALAGMNDSTPTKPTSDSLGDGMAKKAADDLVNYKKKQDQAIKDATGE